MYGLQSISRLSPIFQVWAHVVGDLPPINNISRLTRGPVKPSLTTLADSVACFRGVNRPYDNEEHGESVLVYILHPAVTIDKDTGLVCLAKAAVVPSGTLLTVQVKPLQPPPAGDLQAPKDPLHTGTVTRLEYVGADESNPLLPKQHLVRYQKQLW
jgi:hypothetical protein